MNVFFATHNRLLNAVEYRTHRYLFDNFNINGRLTGIIGPRGTGKTTLILQFIKEKLAEPEKAIYAALDNIYFSSHSLLDFVNELYEFYGIRYFFLDEVHKYSGWNQELKNIYDSYPDIKVVFTGSSSIDLVKGSHDLSRRASMFRLTGMSFREYLEFKAIKASVPLSFADLSTCHAFASEIAGIEKLRAHFKDYLRYGYYPFFLEDKEVYEQKLFRVVQKIVYEDIANFYNLKTENLACFKKILAYIASIPPGELNRNSISRQIGLDNKTVQHYLQILEEVGLARLLASGQAGSRLLKSTEKIFLDNPNLYHAIAKESGIDINLGSIREVFFVAMLKNSGKQVFCSSAGDFTVDDLTFEIGGKNKKLRQIKHLPRDAYLVKDDILYNSNREIPLHLFGYLY